MTTRISLGDVKFAVTATGAVRISLGDVKFAITTGANGSLRVALGLVKFAVRTYPIVAILPSPPPVNTTRSQAPFIKRWR